jgi:hypothetical protein
MRARVDVFGQVIVDGIHMLPVSLMEGFVVRGGRGKVREQVGKKQQFQPPGVGKIGKVSRSLPAKLSSRSAILLILA